MRKGVNTILALSLVLLCLALLVPVPPVRAQLLPEIQDIIALNRLRLDDEWDVEEQRAKFAQLLYNFDWKPIWRMDNVVIIGSNTYGASLTNRTTSALPNSLLPISFGVSLRLSLDLVDREGVGLLPDLWVHPDEASDLAVKFINNYVRDEK